MIPAWLTALAWISLALGFATAAVVVVDIYLGHHRQPMGVMEAVWPVTGLYFGPLALLAYRAWGRPKAAARSDTDHSAMGHAEDHSAMGHAPPAHPPPAPTFAQIAVAASHCGAGCTLGDIVAEWVIFGLGATIAGRALPVEYLGDYVLALALGILFQYFAIAPMRGLSLGPGLVAAAKADFLSLTAFEVGLFGWMAIMQLVLYPGGELRPDTAAYWFLMQVGMVIGFATTLPANRWLIRHGIKEAM